MAQGFTLWFTGLSGAGKTTLTEALVPQLRERGVKVEVLDGDEVRTNLSKGLGFSKEDRDTNIRRIGYVARLLSRNGVGVIAAAISPYREIRDEVRASVEGDGAKFVEVFVQASLDTLVAAMAAQFQRQPGNYLAYFSSFDYLEQACQRMGQIHGQIPVWAQARQMDEVARRHFLQRFDAAGQGIGFAVLGGVFGEGVDLPGARLPSAFSAASACWYSRRAASMSPSISPIAMRV